MIFTHWLVILSAVISLSGSFAYIKDTIQGKTKPNRVTWLMWAVAPLIGTGAALSAGADIWATVRIFLAGFSPAIVFLVSFINPKSFWKLTKFDFLCGISSLIAIIIWLVIGNPIIAVLFAALGDGLAALPTIIKAWKHPETETGILFLAALLACVLILPAIPKWDIENSAFQMYLLSVNIIIIFCIYRKTFYKKVQIQTEI
jgi:hypothetical protein